MTFLKNLFRRSAKPAAEQPELAPGVARSSDAQFDQCVSLAVERVAIAEAQAAAGDNEAYYRLLHGKDGHLLEARPGSGHSYSAILSALHAYQQTHPEADIGARFVQALACNNAHMDSRDAAELSFSYIGLQLKREANQNQAFTCNNQQLFYDLMTAIAHNREDVEDDMPYFADWLEDRKAFIREYL